MTDLEIQALLTEGVPVGVLCAAQIKVETMLFERRLQIRVWNRTEQLHQAREDNPFSYPEKPQYATMKA